MLQPAGHAPGRKDVEQHGLAREVGAGQALIVAHRRQGECRQRLVDQDRGDGGRIMPEAQHEGPDHGGEQRRPAKGRAGASCRRLDAASDAQHGLGRADAEAPVSRAKPRRPAPSGTRRPRSSPPADGPTAARPIRHRRSVRRWRYRHCPESRCRCRPGSCGSGWPEKRRSDTSTRLPEWTVTVKRAWLA